MKKHKNKVFNKRGNISGLESCASEGWVCCMAFSEFDYLLICVEPRKAEYGNVHHINTRNEKESFCCTMDDLLIHLAYFVREGTDKKMAEHHGTKKTTTPRSGLPRPLKMIRKAIVDAMTRWLQEIEDVRLYRWLVRLVVVLTFQYFFCLLSTEWFDKFVFVYNQDILIIDKKYIFEIRLPLCTTSSLCGAFSCWYICRNFF